MMGLSTTAPGDVTEALMRLSKGALVDILVDALAIVCEDVSSEPEDLTLLAVAHFCNPRLHVRGEMAVTT